MPLVIVFILAISLSMDAFSLSLIYGTLNLDEMIEKRISIIVGIFHFFMPLLGYKLGQIILNFLKVDTNIIIGIIFIVLSIEMILSLKEEEKIKILTSILSIIIFALTVSIDSLSVGISLGFTNSNIIIPSTIFSITSFLFTYLGLKLGKTLSKKYGHYATLGGAIIILILGINYLT